MSELSHALFAAEIHEVVILRSLHELPVLFETFRPEAPGQGGQVERALVGFTAIADHVAKGDPQTIGEAAVEPGPLRWRQHHVGVHVPILRLVESPGPMGPQFGSQLLTKTPAMRSPVVVNDTDLVMAEAIDTVLIQQELRVLNQKVPHLRFGKIKHQPAGVTLVREVK
jgi:hypothetical protein